MTSNLMRMLEPKTLTHKIERMRWSNRMDLIALSTEEGKLHILIYFTAVSFGVRGESPALVNNSGCHTT